MLSDCPNSKAWMRKIFSPLTSPRKYAPGGSLTKVRAHIAMAPSPSRLWIFGFCISLHLGCGCLFRCGIHFRLGILVVELVQCGHHGVANQDALIRWHGHM